MQSLFAHQKCTMQSLNTHSAHLPASTTVLCLGKACVVISPTAAAETSTSSKLNKYMQQVEIQAVSSVLAERFNQEVRVTRAPANLVKFIPVSVLVRPGTDLR